MTSSAMLDTFRSSIFELRVGLQALDDYNVSSVENLVEELPKKRAKLSHVCHFAKGMPHFMIYLFG